MEHHIYPWEVIRYILCGYPIPGGQGALKVGSRVCTAQTVCFWEIFIKQKLKGTPENGGTGRVGSVGFAGVLKMHRAKPGTSASVV